MWQNFEVGVWGSPHDKQFYCTDIFEEDGTSNIIFASYSRISDHRPTGLTEDFRGNPKFLQSNYWIVTSNLAKGT